MHTMPTQVELMVSLIPATVTNTIRDVLPARGDVLTPISTALTMLKDIGFEREEFRYLG